MSYRPFRLLGLSFLALLCLPVLTGCQDVKESQQTPGAETATVAPTPPPTPAPPPATHLIDPADCPKPEPVAKPRKCPEAKTVTRTVTVYTPVKVGNKQLFGELETGHIAALELSLPARIDTGARTTSLHATEIELFERDGKNWVRFQNDRSSKGIESWELPLKRTVRIKQKTAGSIERPVVELKVSIGEITQRLEVNLADRSNFEFPLLIGRDFLQDLVIVDVSKRYIAASPEKPDKPEGTGETDDARAEASQ